MSAEATLSLMTRTGDQAAAELAQTNHARSATSGTEYQKAKYLEGSRETSQATREEAASYRVTISEASREANTVFDSNRDGTVIPAPQ